VAPVMGAVEVSKVKPPRSRARPTSPAVRSSSRRSPVFTFGRSAFGYPHGRVARRWPGGRVVRHADGTSCWRARTASYTVNGRASRAAEAGGGGRHGPDIATAMNTNALAATPGRRPGRLHGLSDYSCRSARR